VAEQTKKPTPKVAAAGVGGSLAVVIVWVAGIAGVEVPAEVAAAIALLLSFAAGYLKRERGTGGDHVA